MNEKYILLIGRWSPFHNGHKYIVDSLLAAGKKVCIAIRDTPISDKNPYPSWMRKEMFFAVYGQSNPNLMVIQIPDIEMVVVGRKVGYGLLEVPEDIKKISATDIRAKKSFELPEEVKELIKRDKKWIKKCLK